MDIRLPERSKPGRGSFPTSRLGIRGWLRAFAESGSRARVEKLLAGLHELHAFALPPRTRLRVIRELVAAARPILDDLARRVSGQSLPLPARTRETLQQYLRLLDHLARELDAVVADEVSSGRPARKRVALAAHTALALRAELLLGCAQVYSVPPKNFWRSTHAVFTTAERAGAAQQLVRPLSGDKKRVSPQGEYARILLFAVARTEGLPRGEIRPLFLCLGQWSLAARMDGSGGAMESAHGVIHFDPDTPEPPRLRAGGRDSDEAGPRTLSVAPVVEGLETLERRSADSDAAIADPNSLRPHTVRQLLTTFRQNAERSDNERRAEDQTVEAEVSLRAIQHRLGFTLEEEPAPAQPAKRPSSLTSSASLALQTIDDDTPAGESGFVTHPGHDRMTSAASAWDAVSRRRPDQGAATANGATEPATPGAWKLADSSADGFRLDWACDQPSRATVGELIALRQPASDGSKQWHLGVIRWLRFVDQHRFQLGAERIHGQPRPASVRREPANPNRKRRRGQEHAEPAILIPGQRDTGKAASVLLPAHMFHANEVVEIDVGERTFRVQLEDGKEQTNSFHRFGLRNAPRRPIRRSAERPEGPSLWDES